MSKGDATETVRAKYRADHDAYHAERRATVKALVDSPAEILRRLTSEPMSLRDRVGLTVCWGFRSGLVQFDRDAGVAYAQQSFTDIDIDLLRVALEEPTADIDELEEQYHEWGEPLLATYEDSRLFTDLGYALTTGFGQSVALGMLENSMGDSIHDEYLPLERIDDDVEVSLANELLPKIGLIAEEAVSRDISAVPKTRRVPKRVFDEFVPIAAAALRVQAGFDQPPWVHMLVWCFGSPLRGATPKDAVKHLLSLITGGSHPAPDAFSRQDPEHLRQAEALLRTIRIETSNDEDDDWTDEPEFIPDQVRRGPHVKPWTAAAMFARCFGVTIPGRERDAKRRK